jgi:hypothetical protein
MACRDDDAHCTAPRIPDPIDPIVNPERGQDLQCGCGALVLVIAPAWVAGAPVAWSVDHDHLVVRGEVLFDSGPASIIDEQAIP